MRVRKTITLAALAAVTLGTAAVAEDAPAPKKPEPFAFADFTGDGTLDAAIFSSTNTSLEVLKGQ